MHTLRIAVGATWAVFWVGWLLAAFTAKRSIGAGLGRFGPRLLAAIAIAILIRSGGGHGGGQIHSVTLAVIGTVVFVSGLALAIWARVILGRNWGMPTTQRAEPELITAGPYAMVRHPIYTGILLGVIGTGLTIDAIALVIAAIIGAYFVWAARVEERNLIASFPGTYPAYRARTKMLIPFLL